MAKRVLVIVVVLLVVVGGVYAYYHTRLDRRMNGGEVVDEGAVTTPDGSAPVKSPTRSETEESRSNDMSGETAAATHATNARMTPSATPVQQAYSASPVTDSIPANPANGAVFAGTGKFQVYRQGDLTWRIDTNTGRTCILFATDDQWRKPIVYRNGCPNG